MNMKIPGVPRQVLEDLQGVERRTHPERMAAFVQQFGEPPVLPAPSQGPEEELNHAPVDKGPQLKGPPPIAPTHSKQRLVAGVYVGDYDKDSGDYAVHGGSVTDLDRIQRGPITPVDTTQDVPHRVKKPFAYGPAPGDVVTG